MNCKKCGHSEISETTQTHSNGTNHIRLECTKCGAFNGYKARPKDQRQHFPLKDKLFPYQLQLIAEIQRQYREGKNRVLAVLDTGGGKTFIFSAIAKAVQEKGNHCLIMTDRLLLSEQAVSSLQFAGCKVGIVNNGDFTSPVLIGTVQTIKNRLDKLPTPDLVIIDEAHEGIFKKAFFWPNAKYLGVTGTPVSSSKKDPLKNYYEKAVSVISRPELIEMGRLVPLTFFETKMDLSGLRKNPTGDFTEDSQFAIFGTEASYEALRKEIASAPPKKTVVFCPSVKLTEEVCENLKAWGYESWKIVGSTKKEERREILQKFKHTPHSFLVNCMVATKGFDEPSIERAVLYYATDSTAKYYQTVGRACRSHEGKSGADVFDYGGNLSRFWHPDSRVDWVGMFEGPEKPGEGLAPTKECNGCGSIIPASVKICPFCQEKQPLSEKEAAQEAELALREAKGKTYFLKKMESSHPAKHIQIFSDIAEKQGAQAVRIASKECADLGLKGYKKTYWAFAAAKGIFNVGGEQAVREAYKGTNAQFLDALIQSCKK